MTGVELATGLRNTTLPLEVTSPKGQLGGATCGSISSNHCERGPAMISRLTSWLRARRLKFKRYTSGLLPMYEYRLGRRAYLVYKGDSKGRFAVYTGTWWISKIAETPHSPMGPYPSMEAAKAAAKALLTRRESVASPGW